MDSTLRKKMLKDAVVTITANENGKYTIEVNVWGLTAKRETSDKTLYDTWCNSLTNGMACHRAIDMMLTDLECEALCKYNLTVYNIGGDIGVLYAQAGEIDAKKYDVAMFLAYSSQHCETFYENEENETDYWWEIAESLSPDEFYKYDGYEYTLDVWFESIHSGTVDGIKVSFSRHLDFHWYGDDQKWQSRYDDYWYRMDDEKTYRRLKQIDNIEGVLIDLWGDMSEVLQKFLTEHGIDIEYFRNEDIFEDYGYGGDALYKAMYQIEDKSELWSALDDTMRHYLGDLADEGNIVDMLDALYFEFNPHCDYTDKCDAFSTFFDYDGTRLIYSTILN